MTTRNACAGGLIAGRDAAPAAVAWNEPEAMRAWLAHAVAWPESVRLSKVSPNRLWAGRHGRFTFEWTLELAMGGSLVPYRLQGCAGDHRPVIRTRRDARVNHDLLRGLNLWNETLGLRYCTPDRDRALPALRALLKRKPLTDMLADTAAASTLGLLDKSGTEERSLRSRITAYRAGRRCVLRVSNEGEGASANAVYLKVFRRELDHDQVGRLQRLPDVLATASNGAVRSPALLEHVPAHRFVITEAVPLPRRCVDCSASDLSMVARTAAALHSLPATVGAIHTPRDEFQTLCRWMRAVRVIRGAAPVSLRRVAEALSREVRTIPDPCQSGTREARGATIHRDFYAEQMWVQGDVIWLVDLDTLCCGHAEQDVATFVAHAMLDGLRSDKSPVEAVGMGMRFVDAYRATGRPLQASRLRFYLLCATARLGAIHLLRPSFVECGAQLCELAEQWLGASLEA